MTKKNKMPMLFDVEIKAVKDVKEETEENEETKASKFIGKIKDDFIDNNEVYLKNYIDADLGIAFSHIKNSYKKYVLKSGWEETKFTGVLMILAKHRKMLTPTAFLNYGIKYDEGKLNKEIKAEKLKYNMTRQQLADKRSTPQDISKEEQELLEYIANNGGR